MVKFFYLIIFFITFLKIFENKPNTQNNNRNLQDSSDESYSDSDYSEPDTNGTKIPTTIPETINIDEKIKEQKQIKPTLLDLADYKINASSINNNDDKKNVTNVTISLNLYFKNVAGNNIEKKKSVFLKYIYIKVYLKVKKGKYRKLEEDEYEIIEKILVGELDEKSLDKDVVVYNINDNIELESIVENNDEQESDKEKNIIESISSIDIDPNIKILDEKINNKSKILDEINYGSVTSDIVVSQNLNLNNAQTKTESYKNDIMFFYVENKIHLGFLSYKLFGYSDYNIEGLEKKTLIFSYPQYGEKKTFDGIFEKSGKEGNNYTLSFKLIDFIDADLSVNCRANITSWNISKIRKLSQNNYEILELSGERDILYLDETTPQVNKLGRKIVSSSGLSGGAIAGIVIACVVVLIGVALAFIYFNKPVIKPSDISAIEFYNNNNNSSVVVMQ